MTEQIGGLNAFSRRAAERLFQAHPEWGQFAHSEDGILVIEVPSPCSDRSLLVTTHDDELTVYLQPFAWHAHYGPYLNLKETEFLDQAVEEIDLVLNEKTLIAEHTVSGKWTRSSSFPVDEPDDLRPRRNELVRLRSWRGTHDRDIRSDS